MNVQKLSFAVHTFSQKRTKGSCPFIAVFLICPFSRLTNALKHPRHGRRTLPVPRKLGTLPSKRDVSDLGTLDEVRHDQLRAQAVVLPPRCSDYVS